MRPRSMRIAAQVAESIWIADLKACPQRGQLSVSSSSAMCNSDLSLAQRPSTAPAGMNRRPRGPRAWTMRDLVGLEASAHGHGQHGQRAEGVDELAEHVHPLLSDGCPPGPSSACSGHRPRARVWLAWLQWTAGVSNLTASLASDTPPSCVEECRPRERVPASA